MCLKLILRKHQNQLQLPRLLNRLKRRYMILKLTGVEALCPVYFLLNIIGSGALNIFYGALTEQTTLHHPLVISVTGVRLLKKCFWV